MAAADRLALFARREFCRGRSRRLGLSCRTRSGIRDSRGASATVATELLRRRGGFHGIKRVTFGRDYRRKRLDKSFSAAPPTTQSYSLPKDWRKRSFCETPI